MVNYGYRHEQGKGRKGEGERVKERGTAIAAFRLPFLDKTQNSKLKSNNSKLKTLCHRLQFGVAVYLPV